MPSNVYFIDFRATFQENLTAKLRRLLKTAGFDNIITPKDLTAIKMHFGEAGNNAYINPIYVRTIVDLLKNINAKPFLTDTNTLYKGTRSNALEHSQTAIKNGFAYSVVDAPVIIADGLLGHSSNYIKINGNHFESVFIASDISNADSIVCLSHFKGHELSGFGGALKNMGMGCASRQGKLQMHSTVSPKVKRNKCVGCGDCIKHCPVSAIKFMEKKAVIDPDKCIGCGDCIIVCPNNAAVVQWNQAVPDFLEKMMEYAKGVTIKKDNKIFYINFISNVSPLCDCIGHNDIPIVQDIGILASSDPVAIDMASIDLVNKAPVNSGSCLDGDKNIDDKFMNLYPKVNWKHQIEYAEKLNLGNSDYELIKLETIGLK